MAVKQAQQYAIQTITQSPFSQLLNIDNGAPTHLHDLSEYFHSLGGCLDTVVATFVFELVVATKQTDSDDTLREYLIALAQAGISFDLNRAHRIALKKLLAYKCKILNKAVLSYVAGIQE